MASVAIDHTPDREPWEPQPGETARAFDQFALYRDLGPQRSLAKAAQVIRERHLAQKGKRSTSKLSSITNALSVLSRKHGWQARVEAYDLYRDRLLREASDTELQEASRRQAGLGVVFQRIALERVHGKGKPNTPGYVPPLSAAELDASDVALFADKGVRIERQARGQPTDLIRGTFFIAPADLQTIVGQVMDEALLLIPEEKHEQFIMAVRRIGTR